MTMGERLREIALMGWVLAMLSFSWIYSDIRGPNEFTRAYLTAAIVDQHSIQLDQSLQHFGGVYDLAAHEGHFYSDKAPGSSFIAAPAYAIARRNDKPEEWNAARIVILTRNWVMLPLSLLGFWMLRSLLRRLGKSAQAVDLGSLGYALGCAVYHYSAAFYGHVMVSTLLIGALWCMASAGVLVPSLAPPGARFDPASTSTPSRTRLLKMVVAGLLAGLGGFTEYQATLLAVLLLVPILLSGPGRYSAALAYLIGAAPFALALLAYNRAAFGGPFELSYHHLVVEAMREKHSSGVAGATWPTKESVLGLLFSGHRGMITMSPWVAFGLVGLISARRRMTSALWFTLLVPTLYFFVAVASSSVWHGGWAAGPRLMIPAYPLLAISAAYVFDAVRPYAALDALARASVIVGLVYQQLIHVTFAELPAELTHPLHQSVWPLLKSGGTTPNLMCKFFPLGPKNLIPLALSLCLLALLVAVPRALKASTQALRALASFALSAAFLWGLWKVEPETTPEQETGWTMWIAHMMTVERSCGVPSDQPR